MIAYFSVFFHILSVRKTARPSAGAILKKAHVQAILVTSLVNIRYLTGINVSAGYLLISKKGFEFFLDARYAEAAKTKVRRGIRVKTAQEFSERMKKLRKLGIEASNMTLAEYGAWKRKCKNTKFVQTVDVIEEFRRAKYPDEISAMNEAADITRAVLKKIPRLLTFGMTERELAWMIENECRKKGAEGMAFETIVGFGTSTSRPHHRPSERKLKRGEIVQIDMGATWGGYCSDYSRVYFTGPKTPAQVKAYRALTEAKSAAEKILKAGVTTRELDQAARKVLKSHGYDEEFCHALGHGVGIEIHEGPTLSQKAKPVRLKKNEVVTIEPGLYFPGKWGMRVEDTVVV